MQNKNLKLNSDTQTSLENSDETLDRIMDMVDISNKQFENLSEKEQRIAIARDVQITTSGNNQCWHDDCTHKAHKRLHMNQENINLGTKFVHNQRDMSKNINQLCLTHFNSAEYDLQKIISSIIENI